MGETLGGLTQGFGQGFMAQQERARKKKELDLKEKLGKAKLALEKQTELNAKAGRESGLFGIPQPGQPVDPTAPQFAQGQPLPPGTGMPGPSMAGPGAPAPFQAPILAPGPATTPTAPTLEGFDVKRTITSEGKVSVSLTPKKPTIPKGRSTDFIEVFSEIIGPPEDRTLWDQDSIALVNKTIRDREQASKLEIEKAGAISEAQTQRGISEGEPMPPFIRQLFGMEKATRGEIRAATGANVPKLASPEVQELGRVITNSKQGAIQLDELIDIVKTTPEAFGFTGTIAATFAGVVGQVNNAFKLLEKNSPGSFDGGLKSMVAVRRWLNEAGAFESVGIRNVDLQAKVILLAFTLAEAKGIRGRQLTDRKIQILRDMMGASTQSPKAFVRVLLGLRTRLNSDIQAKASGLFLAPVGGVVVPPRKTPVGEIPERGVGPAPGQRELDEFGLPISLFPGG